MSLLQYTSDEMFSATELVRKNKIIFDKLQKKEIEKAIILRDGKPSIIVMDFVEYEKIMKDYLHLKSNDNTNPNTQKMNEDKSLVKISSITQKADSKISEDEYESAMKEIEKISFDTDFSKNEEIHNSQPLKEFWEK